MMKASKKKTHGKSVIFIWLLTVCVLISSLIHIYLPVFAEGESVVELKGSYFEFDEKTKYSFSDENSVLSKEGNTFGCFCLNGDFTETAGMCQIYKGNLKFSYSFNPRKLDLGDAAWHLKDDKIKDVDTIKLHKDIMSGAVILQSSLDGETWTTDVEYTDVFTKDGPLNEAFYTTKDIQQENGCYFRAIVVYKLQRLVGTHKVAFFSVDDKETKRVAEVYDFYVVNSAKQNITSSKDTPRKELGIKTKTDTDKGYTGEKTIDKDDPHYGWELGNFTVNGYTRETKDDAGTPVFLKNVGDKVTLWFTLKQDINTLNGDDTLSIAVDKNGYDQHFEIPKTNFGKGTLIIRYTDYEGVRSDPIIYTNYLESNTKTGADTKVRLFEEGDYEVALDYEIKNNPRQIGPVSVVPTFTDYRIMFKFKIRNGNCMVFPFDLTTGGELFDYSIAKDGFKLDMAKSRYLTIDVKKSVISVSKDGLLAEDVRFNRPAKDGEEYTDEGIYVFTVSNLYTGSEPTTKTIYVGNDKYLVALSRLGLSINELNELISRGYVVDDAGNIVEPLTNSQITGTDNKVSIFDIFGN
jgi:hypothetical protein